MAKHPPTGLSRRERQIMDVLYQRGRASARDVRDAISDAPSYSAVRALLRVLEDKGHVKHVENGPRYLYVPIVSRDSARVVALTQLVRTFFAGNASQAVAALINESEQPLTQAELKDLAALVRAARAEGR